MKIESFSVGVERDFRESAERRVEGDVRARFGAWVVTDRGVDCLLSDWFDEDESLVRSDELWSKDWAADLLHDFRATANCEGYEDFCRDCRSAFAAARSHFAALLPHALRAGRVWVAAGPLFDLDSGPEPVMVTGGRIALAAAEEDRPVAPAKARREMPASLRWKILSRDGFRCRRCGRSPETDEVTLHVDHIHPVCMGGTNDEANLRTLCADCNLGKGIQLDEV